MTIDLRPFEAGDRDAVARVWHLAFASMPVAPDHVQSEERSRARLSDEGREWTILVAIREGRIVGFVAWLEREAWLRELFVAPGAQGLGIGRQLLDAAKGAMPGGFWLRTPTPNADGRRFYEREGLNLRGLADSDAHPFTFAIYDWPGAAGTPS